jgi:hypothetical protein
MLAIVLDTIDDRPHNFAKLARVKRKDGAYHEKKTFKIVWFLTIVRHIIALYT